MLTKWIAVAVYLSTVGCVSVQPPAATELAMNDLAARTTLAAYERESSAAVSSLSTAARNFRQRQIDTLLAVGSDDPATRATAVADMKAADQQAAENEKELKDLLGGGFGLGVTVTLARRDRIETADVFGTDKVVRVTKDSKVIPRVLLETHYLFTTNPFSRTATVKTAGGKSYSYDVAAAQLDNCRNDEAQCPTVGVGPFIGLQQSSDHSSFDALAVGVAFGFRPGTKAGITIGIGAMFDSSVKQLGNGITEGQPLPAGETTVRFRETSQVSPVLSVALTF